MPERYATIEHFVLGAMRKVVEFREGTDVLTASGEKLGEVERVIDPRTREVTHIVVKKGFLFTEDRVLPIEVVDSADGEQVVLSQNVGDDLEAWPVFEETYTIPIDQMPNTDTLGPPGETARTVSARPAPAYYWYPPAGVGLSGRQSRAAVLSAAGRSCGAERPVRFGGAQRGCGDLLGG